MAEAIISLYQKRFSERKIAELLNKPKTTVHDAIERFQFTGSAKSRQGQGGGRPRTARTPANKRKIKGRIQRNKSQSIEALKKSLVAAWNKIPQDVIDRAVDEFPKRLQKCIDAGGGHFENK